MVVCSVTDTVMTNCCQKFTAESMSAKRSESLAFHSAVQISAFLGRNSWNQELRKHVICLYYSLVVGLHLSILRIRCSCSIRKSTSAY